MRAFVAMALAVFTGISVVVLGVPVAANAAGDVWVDSAWSGASNGDSVMTPSGAKTVGTDAFATISASLAATPATIHLAAGSYPEQLDFNGVNVTVIGAGSASTFIDRGADPLVVINGVLPFVAVRGGGSVTMSGVTVRGSGSITNPPSAPPPYIVGVLISGGAALELTDSVVTGIRDHPAITGAQGGTGIMVGTSGGETGSLTLRDSVVSDYQKTGIIIRANSSASIERTEVVGQGWICETAVNGIQIQGSATIVDSVVRDNRYEKRPAPTPPTPDPCGSDKTATPVGVMMFSPTGPVTVSDSTISGNELGFYLSQTGTAPITIEGNTVTGLLGDPFATEGSYGMYLTSSGAGVGASVDHNALSDSTYGLLTSGPQSITSNLIQSNETGIGLLDAPALVAANAVLGNTTGVDGAFSNAGSNWYGCNAGPGAAGCDTVTGGYDEPEWLIFTMELAGCTVPQGGDLAVTAAIMQTSGGVETSGHFVPTLPITPISGTGVTPVAPTTTIVNGSTTLQFIGSSVGPAGLSATAQNQVITSPGEAAGCAAGITVTLAELPATGAHTARFAAIAGLTLLVGLCLVGFARVGRTRRLGER